MEPTTPISQPVPQDAPLSPPNRTPLYIGIAVVVLAALAGVLYWFTPLFTQGEKERTEPLKVGVIQYVRHLDEVLDGFKLGLAELGYEEGVDIVYEYQSSDGDVAKAKEIARGYIEGGADLILAITSPTAQAAYDAMQEEGVSIPIVFTNGIGVIESGLAESYQSSGKNLTGVVPDDVEVTIKKLEFMKQIQPTGKKVGVFYGQPASSATRLTLEALREQSPALGLTLVEFPITVPPPQSPAAMQKVADALKVGDVDAFVTVPDGVSNFKDNPKIIIEASKRLKAPVYFLTVPRVFEGGLLSYSQDYIVFGKQAAAMADKIFKGVHPKDIPIEPSTKNLLIINLKTAREMGLTIPDSLLFVADQVIPAE